MNQNFIQALELVRDKKLSPEDIKAILPLLSGPMTTKQIAERINKPYILVSKTLKLLSIKGIIEKDNGGENGSFIYSFKNDLINVQQEE